MTQVTEHTTATSGLTLPAMIGQQGGRTVYMTAIHMSAFAEQIPVITDTPKADLKEQRLYDAAHAGKISKYLLTVADYILPPLVISIDRPPIWQPIEPGSQFGLVTVTPETKRRITDGLHRGDGIAQGTASDDDGKLDGDHIGLWIVVEPKIESRRMMFADVNHHQKSVPKSLSITYDVRDPYAIALRRLVDGHPLLKGVVEEEKSRAPKGSGKVFTMAALRDALENFAGRGLTDPIEIERAGKTLFTAIGQARPELSGLVGDPTSIDQLRKASIIVSSTTLRVMASALHVGLSRGKSIDDLTDALGRVSFKPGNELWIDAGFTSLGSTSPSSRNQEVRAAAQALADEIAPV